MNDGTQTLLLPPALTGLLKSLQPGNTSSLFPFPEGNLPTDAEQTTLQESGFLNKNGELTAAAESVLKNLKQAAAATRLRLMCDGELLEFHVFHAGPDRQDSTSFHPAGEHWQFNSPAAISGLLTSVRNLTGRSVLSELPTLGSMGSLDSFVLAGLMDCSRRQLLIAMGEDRPWQPSGVDVADLEKLLGSKSSHPGWLLWMLHGLNSEPLQLKAKTLSESLLRLEKKGWIEKLSSGFVVSGEALFITGRFLQLPTVLRLDMDVLAAEGIQRTSFGVIQNGVRNLLLIEPGRETWHWGALSADALVVLIETCLNDPGALMVNTDETPCACVSCGKQINPEDPFCKFCGTAQSLQKEKSRFCSGCGVELKPGKSFCSKCGKKKKSP